MENFKVSAEAVLSGILGTASLDFIYNRNKEVIDEIRKSHGMKFDKNGCYI